MDSDAERASVARDEWAVLSSNLHKYDTVKPPPTHVGDADVVLVTDTAATARTALRYGWRVVTVPTSSDPWYDSRRPKFEPHLYTDRRFSVWVDARTRFGDVDCLDWAARCLDGHEMAAFPHPYRRSIREEASECFRIGLVDESVFQQLDEYENLGFPSAEYPLLAGGVIIRRHTSRVEHFGSIWRAETDRWRTRDQISLPFAAWKAGLQFGVIAGSPYEQPGFELEPHRKPRRNENASRPTFRRASQIIRRSLASAPIERLRVGRSRFEGRG